MLGEPGQGRLGRRYSPGRAHAGDMRGRAADDQQPDGDDRRHRGPGRRSTRLPGDRVQRQPVRRQHHDEELEAEEEPGPVEQARPGDGRPPGDVGVDQGSRRPSHEREGGQAGYRAGKTRRACRRGPGPYPCRPGGQREEVRQPREPADKASRTGRRWVPPDPCGYRRQGEHGRRGCKGGHSAGSRGKGRCRDAA